MAVGWVPARAPGTSPGDGEGEGHTHAALASGETLDRVDRVSLADLTTGSSVHLAREKAGSGGILSPHCDDLTCYIRNFLGHGLQIIATLSIRNVPTFVQSFSIIIFKSVPSCPPLIMNQ